MKPGRVFWGVFFLVVGLVLMLDRVTPLNLHVALSWKLWPLLLVIWGLGLAINGRVARYLFAVLAGILMAFLVLSAFGGFWWGEDEEWGTRQAEQTFREEYASTITRATFALESAAGSFTLNDTTHDLMTAETESDRGSYRLERTVGDSVVHLSLEYSGADHAAWFRYGHNAVRVRLHPDPVWDLRLDVGASRLEVDASPLKVGSMEIGAGAAEVRVKLGSRATKTDVTVKTGASSVTMLIPESSGCELRVNAPLSVKEFKRFSKVSKGLYRTDNFDTSSAVVSVVLNAGVSTLNVIRY